MAWPPPALIRLGEGKKKHLVRTDQRDLSFWIYNHLF